jgi:Calcineurin-like phosphoesterase
VRTAVLADIHGNLPALRAVLHELDQDDCDVIVICGDVVGGPLVRETLELLAARREPTRWIRGNCEREAVAVYDGAPVSDGRSASGSTMCASATALPGATTRSSPGPRRTPCCSMCSRTWPSRWSWAVTPTSR